MTLITMSTAVYNIILISIAVYFLLGSYNIFLDIKSKLATKKSRKLWIENNFKHPPDNK